MRLPRRVWLLAALVAVGLLTAVTLFLRQEPLEQVFGYRPGEARTPGPAFTTVQPGQKQPAPVPTVTVEGHPRLFFSKDDIPVLRRQAETTHKEIWEPILRFAQGQLGAKAPSMPKEKDLEGFRNAGDQVIAFAFAYVVTGDRQYLELTKRTLLAYASWKHWGDEQGYGSRDLGFHHMLMGNAIAYDWVFNDLSAQDRSTIGRALASRAQESYEASTSSTSRWDNWWRKAYTQNHHWINHSALGIAALALDKEDSRAGDWLDQAVENLRRDTYSAQQIGDGTWHEGISYQDYAYTMSLPFLHNLRRLEGEDLIPHDYLKNYTLWRVYNNLPGSPQSAFSFADLELNWGSTPHGPEGILRFIAREYKDGRAEWMVRQLLSTSARQDTVYNAPLYVFEFLYYDPTVAPQPPEGLPLSRTFPDLEGVIWRTGWGEDDLVFSFKTGVPGGRFFYDAFLGQKYPFDPNSDVDFFHTGHDHLDANSFNLFRGKVDLASERADYQKIDTSYHNSILVDGKGQPRKDPNVDDPRAMRNRNAELQAVGNTANFDFLMADATDRYAGVLDDFRRFVLFVRPNYLVMVDSLESSSERRYEWVSHFGDSVSREGDWLKGTSEVNNVIGVNFVAPAKFDVSRGEDGKPYARARPTEDVEDTRFATVLLPTTADKWNEKPEVSSLGDNGQAIGVRVGLDGTQDHLIKYGRDGSTALGDYTLDGRVASVTKGPDGKLRRVLLGQGARLADNAGSRVLIQAPGELAALEVNYQGASVSISGNAAGGVRIFAPGVDPRQVTLNGQPASVSQNGDYLELPR